MKSVTVNTSLSQATTGAPCTLLAVNTCTLVDPFAATGGFATSTVGGTFILLATSIPIPALTAWNLLLLGGLLVLLAAAVARSARPFVDGENT